MTTHRYLFDPDKARCECGNTAQPANTTTGALHDAWAHHLTTIDVATLLGITFRQLDYWIRTGRVPLADPTPGTGYHRVWTADAISTAARITALLNAGLTLPAAARITASGDIETSTPGVRITLIPAEVHPW